MTRTLYVTSLAGWCSERISATDGRTVELEWIQLKALDGAAIEIPIVRIPESLDRRELSWRILRDEAERLVGEVMKETILVLWRRPQRFFVTMADRARIADLNELWYAYEHQPLAPSIGPDQKNCTRYAWNVTQKIACE